MKIIRSLLVVASFAFLISCGSKAPVEEACLCEKLNKKSNYTYSYQGQSYTGICKTKDQHDSLLERKEFKNGFLINSFIREKHGDKYVNVHNMTYDNLKSVNGFTIKYTSNSYANFVHSVVEFKEGKQICDLSIEGITSGSFYLYNNMDLETSLKDEGSTGDYKTDFISFLEKVKKVDNRFEYFVK
jgi:hypothetical protein